MLTKASALALLATLAATGPAVAQTAPGGFHLDRLPSGKNVTIPRPATTYVPLSRRVQFTGTDMPQTLSFRPINLRAGGAVGTIRIAIHDVNNKEPVMYADLSPGTPFLYTVKDLRPILIVPEAPSGADGLVLQVESNKPLEITH